MRVVSRFTLLAVLAAGAIAGCNDDRRRQLPVAPTEVAPDQLSAYVMVSDPAPEAGSRFTVSVRTLRGSAVGPVGSFTIELAFDSTQLRFHEAARSGLGMVMANGAKPGVVIAAGAAALGFTSDELLEATFSVLPGADPGEAIETLTLNVTELNSLTFENERGRVRVSSQVHRDAPRMK